MDEEIITRKVDRRRLLGRAGAVAATVAGAGAVSAAVASPAEAAPGGNFILGQPNDAGTAATTLTNNSPTNGSLVLHNTNTNVDGGITEAGPALVLTPKGDWPVGPPGTVGFGADGAMYAVDGAGFSDFVRTGLNSTIVKSFTPVRMLDTRDPALRTNVLNPSVLTPQGFVPGGQTLHLSLDSLFFFVETIFANLTVIAGPNDGFLTAFPGGSSRPLASNVNFGKGAVLSNFAVIGVGPVSPADFAISLYCHTPAQVIVDISGAVVNYDIDINWARVPGGGPGLRPARPRRRPRPETPQRP